MGWKKIQYGWKSWRDGSNRLTMIFSKANAADLASLAAARQDLTRAQISERDASARASLRQQIW
jgi:hypothetical protein